MPRLFPLQVSGEIFRAGSRVHRPMTWLLVENRFFTTRLRCHPHRSPPRSTEPNANSIDQCPFEADSPGRSFSCRRQLLGTLQAVFPAALSFLLDVRLALAEPFNLQFEVFFPL